MNLGHWKGLQGLADKQMEHILCPVCDGVLSLNEMNKEGDILKKVVKTKKMFMQCSQETDWNVCKERYPAQTAYPILHAWAKTLTDAVSKRFVQILIESLNSFRGLVCKLPDLNGWTQDRYC
jgi:23S rRNA G2069 N7-methylase RlmK/C1962 C5-methylase RlmI